MVLEALCTAERINSDKSPMQQIQKYNPLRLGETINQTSHGQKMITSESWY